jgi:uncharacterized membrane protein SpoIIM required for sporulation
MSREAFEARHRRQWQRLEELVAALEHRRFHADRAQLPELYRHVCHHLALARHRLYGHDLELALNRLVQRAHQQIYGPLHPGAGAIARLLLEEFPRAVRRRAGLFLVSCLCFFGPLLTFFALATVDLDFIAGLLDPATVAEYRQMYEPAPVEERGLAGDLTMFGHYIHNNVSIALRSFASGVFAGVGSLFVLIFNGCVLGAVGGFLHAEGLGPQFWPFVAGHSSFELVGLVLAGMSGLLLGLAVLQPGRRSRGLALREEARAATPIIAGAATLVMVAAVIEAFWSASALPSGLKYLAGVAGWFALAAFLLLGGRRNGS